MIFCSIKTRYIWNSYLQSWAKYRIIFSNKYFRYIFLNFFYNPIINTIYINTKNINFKVKFSISIIHEQM